MYGNCLVADPGEDYAHDLVPGVPYRSGFLDPD